VAELEAKKSLNDFINKETITSTTSVKMISQNLEQARDQKTNRFSSNKAGSDELVAVDETVDREKNMQATRDENTAVRNDALKISSIVNTTITNTNQGILGGLYMVDGQAINSGKNVRVVMRWDRKHEDIRLQVRGLMMR
jgi:ABC-type transport system involved in cytochrome bd biosynthesis fused ATPase/permease subunit